MKKLLIAISLMTLAILLAYTPSPATAADFKIDLLNPPKHGVLTLAVGQSYTFDIEVTSDEPFILAIAHGDQFFPGRGIFYHDNDTAQQTTSAMLHLTMTGKESTAALPAVCDWPEPGDCWPEGVAPVSIVVGVRFQGGVVVSERFDFVVQVD